ncbi:hypothetical protein CAPTEDRAFT_199224 [Capitella teleta]|uniref:FLYWCH-type domain-containing protein n=1 Tax=Capitella teleta TaxID=283909 RepID=R7T5Y2_CAPTE|nr:hypothetical protein CAPTEDRAFT_199224 [Capitella teleta]|eukprot:ELT88869.1 hypothetical protein CAPTEDRAFT_199224 [Capitella teleta]
MARSLGPGFLTIDTVLGLLNYSIGQHCRVTEELCTLKLLPEPSHRDDSLPTHEGADSLFFEKVEMGTKRNRTKLVDSLGFTYNVKREGKSVVNWQCTVRNKSVNCPATVREENGSFKTCCGHIHPAARL